MIEVFRILKAVYQNKVLRPYNDVEQRSFDREEVEKREKVVVYFAILVTLFLVVLILPFVVPFLPMCK